MVLFLYWYHKRIRKYHPQLVRVESLRMECLGQFPWTELTPMQDSKVDVVPVVAHADLSLLVVTADAR